jgi:hypothetical protein
LAGVWGSFAYPPLVPITNELINLFMLRVQ